MAVDRTCMLRVWTTNQDGDVTSWYKIWAAANAVYFRCVHAGAQGTFKGLGKSWVATITTGPLILGTGNNHQLFLSFLGPQR